MTTKSESHNQGRLVLVTGGAGFIGSHLVARLVAEGARVRVLDDSSSGRPDNLSLGIELIVADVADPEPARRSAGHLQEPRGFGRFVIR